DVCSSDLNLRRAKTAGEDGSTEDVLTGQILRRRLVLLVLEQPADEFGPRIPPLLLRLLRRYLLARKEHPALDVSERGRHHQKLARHVEVHRAHAREVCEVLVEDEGDGDVEDVEPVLPDQVEQEIERPLERRKPQPEIRRRRRQLRGRLDLARLGPRHDPYPAIARVMASIQSWMTTTGQRIRLPPKKTTARRRKGA